MGNDYGLLADIQLPSIWGTPSKGEDPYAPVEQGCCSGQSPLYSQTITY